MLQHQKPLRPATAVIHRSGERPEHVSIRSQGYKHSAIPIICAALLSENLPMQIQNVPDVEDIRVLVQLISKLGGQVDYSHETFTIYSANFTNDHLDGPLASSVHGSIYLWPVILAKVGSLDAPIPGGCPLGGGAYANGRPIQNLLDITAIFGAQSHIANGRLHVSLDQARLSGQHTIDIARWSAGQNKVNGAEVTSSSKFALLMAAAAGHTEIKNIAQRESVTDLAHFINSCLRQVEMGSSFILRPVRRTGPTFWRIDSDPTELMTYLALAVLLDIPLIQFCGVSAGMLTHRMPYEIAKLRQMGVEINQNGQEVIAKIDRSSLRGVRVVASTAGINTDSQPFFALMFACALSKGRITDTIWKGRYGYAERLGQFGIDVQRTAFGLTIPPTDRIRACTNEPIIARDTREAAQLCCLAAAGSSQPIAILQAKAHLARGYSSIESKFAQFGVALSFND